MRALNRLDFPRSTRMSRPHAPWVQKQSSNHASMRILRAHRTKACSHKPQVQTNRLGRGDNEGDM